MTNIEVLRAVLDAWGASDEEMSAAFRAHFSDDCRFEQAGSPTTTGPEEAIELQLVARAMGFSGVGVDYRNLAEVDGIVYSERVDWALRSDGTRVGPFPVAGVTEFKDSKIVAWREYLDTALFALLAEPAPEAG